MLSYTPFFTNNFCSAGCSHCPYGQNPARTSDAVERLQDLLNGMAPNNVVLVTGGEPVEDENIKGVLQLLENRQRWYRIATGGHKDLSKMLGDLQFLTGVSLGTDCFMPARKGTACARGQWAKNIAYLESAQISYSLTITLLPEDCADFSWINDMPVTRHRFIMVMYPEGLMDGDMGKEILSGITDHYAEECLIFNSIPQQRLRA